MCQKALSGVLPGGVPANQLVEGARPLLSAGAVALPERLQLWIEYANADKLLAHIINCGPKVMEGLIKAAPPHLLVTRLKAKLLGKSNIDWNEIETEDERGIPCLRRGATGWYFAGTTFRDYVLALCELGVININSRAHDASEVFEIECEGVANGRYSQSAPTLRFPPYVHSEKRKVQCVPLPNTGGSGRANMMDHMDHILEAALRSIVMGSCEAMDIRRSVLDAFCIPDRRGQDPICFEISNAYSGSDSDSKHLWLIARFDPDPARFRRGQPYFDIEAVSWEEILRRRAAKQLDILIEPHIFTS